MNYACCTILCTTYSLLQPFSANIFKSTKVIIFCFYEIFPSIVHISKTHLVLIYQQHYFPPPLSYFHAHLLAQSYCQHPYQKVPAAVLHTSSSIHAQYGFLTALKTQNTLACKCVFHHTRSRLSSCDSLDLCLACFWVAVESSMHCKKNLPPCWHQRPSCCLSACLRAQNSSCFASSLFSLLGAREIVQFTVLMLISYTGPTIFGQLMLNPNFLKSLKLLSRCHARCHYIVHRS